MSRPRLRELTAWLASEGRIDVVDAARRLGVAPETIRRDLRTLESEGRLQRVHGGAVPATDPDPSITGSALRPDEQAVGPYLRPYARSFVGTSAGPFVGAMPGTKSPIGPSATPDPPREAGFGRLVWSRLPRSGTLLLGAGRLSHCLAQIIAADPPPTTGLTVVTNALDTAVLLSRVPQLSVYNLGGTVDPDSQAQLGDWALSELRRLRTDVAVIAPAGVSADSGLTETTPAAAALGHAVVATGRRLVVLADVRTLGAVGFVRFASIGEADELFVLGPVPDRVRGPFDDRGVAMTVIEEER